jgi:hypothetical protein
MARAASLELSGTDPTCIVKNLGASDAYVFAGVALPASALAISPLLVWASREEALGDSTSAVYTINNQMGGGGFGPTGFMQLLLPGEQLYMQIAVGAPATQRIVVATVSF